MKTNFRRGFVRKRLYLGQRPDVGFEVWSGRGETVLSGHIVSAGSTLSSENSRSIARSRAGAKKFVRSRTRFHENSATRRLAKEEEI